MIDLLLRECDSLGVGRRPALREVPSLAAPAVFGLMRQTICFPRNLIEALTEQELRWVIRHELAHIRRRDIAVIVTASVATACHWFNPLVWLIVSRLRLAMEAAADRIALQSLSHSEASAYGTLLLRFAENGANTNRFPTLGLIPFASGGHLKQRVDQLMRGQQSHGVLASSLSAGLVAVIASIGLTDATAVTRDKTPEVHLVTSDSLELRPQLLMDPYFAQESDGPAFVAEYDVASVFRSMPESLRRSGGDPTAQLTAWLPLPSSVSEELRVDGQTLFANLTARQHQLLKQTLETWKNGEPRQISIEARIIRTNFKTASSIDWAGRRVEELKVKGMGPAIAARIGEGELGQLIRAVSADRQGNIMFAPKVTLFDGQTASIADQVQRPFVTGVDPKANGELRPVVSILHEGVKSVLTPKVAEDNVVTLAFEVSASRVGKVSYANLPIRSLNQAAPQFTVQVPATEQLEVSSTAQLPAGESIVVAIPGIFSLEPGADAETATLVALTPRIIGD